MSSTSQTVWELGHVMALPSAALSTPANVCGSSSGTRRISPLATRPDAGHRATAGQRVSERVSGSRPQPAITTTVRPACTLRSTSE